MFLNYIFIIENNSCRIQDSDFVKTFQLPDSGSTHLEFWGIFLKMFIDLYSNNDLIANLYRLLRLVENSFAGKDGSDFILSIIKTNHYNQYVQVQKYLILE